jgi:3-oxoacyl-[acyl-carrier protein] reductase
VSPAFPRQVGRVALVTGASKGIGRTAARRLAAEGAAVAVNFRTDEAGALETVRLIEADGGRAIAVGADVSHKDDVLAMVARVVEDLGRLDILVNNAAIFPWRTWTEIEPDEWDRVLAVDLKGCLLTSQAAYPQMQARGWGRIVSMTSATALRGHAQLMHYAAAKAGIIGFTRSLARAVGDDGITVNAVSTGTTLTEGYQRWIDDGTVSLDDMLATRMREPIKRLATPDDVAAAIAYIASDDAAFMTGQVLNVDGGRHMY